ncbi:MAG: hypothetical protein WC852_04505 [Candidatus Nanoarchaeia archaeon]|jgi:hypothetical protein
MKGLEDRLDGVHVGDLLCLQRTNEGTTDIVTGFVKKYSNEWVVLSHEAPKNKEPYLGTWNNWHVTNGDRRYFLQNFDTYQVIALPAIENK